MTVHSIISILLDFGPTDLKFSQQKDRLSQETFYWPGNFVLARKQGQTVKFKQLKNNERETEKIDNQANILTIG